MCVSSDNSFPSVRQEPTLTPWKGSPFLHQKQYPGENIFKTLSCREGSQRRQWKPAPVLLPGESHGQRSLIGCNPGVARVGRDFTERLHFHFSLEEGHWRRTWQPTPVCLPGESQGQRSLVNRRLWGRAESDTTEATQQQQQQQGRKWHHLHYSGLRNPRDRGDWYATVQKQGISEGRKQSQGS